MKLIVIRVRMYQRDFLNFSQDRPVLHLAITKDLKSDNHDGKYMFQLNCTTAKPQHRGLSKPIFNYSLLRQVRKHCHGLPVIAEDENDIISFKIIRWTAYHDASPSLYQ